MSCPNWRALYERGAADGDDPAWRAAVQHLDGCDDCRAAALQVDPLLMFRRLSAPEAGRDEIEAMKRSVANMRRTESIEHRAATPRRWLAVAAPRRWLQAAAVSGLLLGAAWYQTAPQVPGAIVAPAETFAVETPAFELPAEVAAELLAMPLIEPGDVPFGSIIQWDDAEMSLVVVTSDVLPSPLDQDV